MFSKPVGCAFLVEDNKQDIAIFEYAARKHKFPITLQTHMTGSEAVAAINGFDGLNDAQLPSLFVLDVDLPDINGGQVFKKLREAYSRRGRPVPPTVFLTHGDIDIVRQLLALDSATVVRNKPSTLNGYQSIFSEMFDLTTDSASVH